MHFKIEPSHLYAKWPCCTCGEWFDMEAVIAMAYVREQAIGYVCPSCLQAEGLSLPQ